MTNLASAFAGIKEAQAEPVTRKAAHKPAITKKPGSGIEAAAPARIIGKSSHPDYASLKIYVRKETRRKAARKWEDAGGSDLSDLIEHLLSKYAGA